MHQKIVQDILNNPSMAVALGDKNIEDRPATKSMVWKGVKRIALYPAVIGTASFIGFFAWNIMPALGMEGMEQVRAKNDALFLAEDMFATTSFVAASIGALVQYAEMKATFIKAKVDMVQKMVEKFSGGTKTKPTLSQEVEQMAQESPSENKSSQNHASNKEPVEPVRQTSSPKRNR